MAQVRKLIGLLLVMAAIIGVPVAYHVFSSATDRILAFSSLPSPPLDVYPFLAAFFMVIGLFWVFWAYSYLHFVGLGSPVEVFRVALHPTELLVTTGPYAYTRNPMFLGLLFVLLAVALYGKSITGLALLPIIAIAGLEYLRVYEEPVLKERFGQEYSSYRKSVPALFPRNRR